jgi:hypothetical protein
MTFLWSRREKFNGKDVILNRLKTLRALCREAEITAGKNSKHKNVGVRSEEKYVDSDHTH